MVSHQQSPLSTGHMWAKGIMSLLAAAYAWEAHNLGPLFFVLIALVTVDLLFNMSNPNLQWSKLISGFAALGGPKVIGGLFVGGIPSATTIHLLEALMVMVYVQVVYPQVISWVQSWKWGKTTVDKAQEAAMLATIKSLEAKLEGMAAQTEATASPKEAEATSTKGEPS